MAKETETRRAEALDGDQRNGLNSGLIPRDNAKDNDSASAKRRANPTDKRKDYSLLVGAGIQWRSDYPTAWSDFEAHVAYCVENKKPFHCSDLFTVAHRHDHTNTRTGDPMKLDKTLLPFFYRWLIAEHPEAAPLAELRKSMFDGHFPGLSDGLAEAVNAHE